MWKPLSEPPQADKCEVWLRVEGEELPGLFEDGEFSITQGPREFITTGEWDDEY